MRLSIRHTTTYRYGTPVAYSIQHLRLTPVNGPGQIVLNWDMQVPGKAEASRDTYDNVMHALVLARPHSEIRLDVLGEVETLPLRDGVLGPTAERIPVAHFTCAGRLTAGDEAVLALAHANGPLQTPGDLVRLAERIAESVAYQGGFTDVSSTAAEALRLGYGVCQDHAHVMLACCRGLGRPARYVSGYLNPGDAPHAASHAWVDVWLDEYGWVTVDVTHARFASEQYCRVAVGRDYETAAPVRGSRIGGGEERMAVAVSVALGLQAQHQQQQQQ